VQGRKLRNGKKLSVKRDVQEESTDRLSNRFAGPERSNWAKSSGQRMGRSILKRRN